MKKVLFSLLAAIATVIPVKSQNYLWDNPDNHAHFGVRLGLDIISLSSTENRYGTKAGFNLSGIYNIPLWKNLYFEPGLGIFYDGGMINAVYTTDNVKVLDRGSLKNFGFRVPFNFGYRFDATNNVSLHIFTGPQLNYNVSFGTYYDGVKATNQPEADFNKLDLQWNIGLGVDYGSYYAYIQNGLGLTHLIKAKDYNYNEYQLMYPGARRNLFSIGVGYNF